jgi:hypothetical protein
MPKNGNAVTVLGDAALTQLSLRLLSHDQLTFENETLLRQNGRHIWLEQIGQWHANALVDLVAVAENFTTKRLIKLHPSITEFQVSTWEKRKREWRRNAGIDLSTITPDWARLSGFIEARNAFQHGLGHLTEMQLSANRRTDVLSGLTAAHVPLIGDMVRVEGETVTACHDVCEAFVISLDNKAPYT